MRDSTGPTRRGSRLEVVCLIPQGLRKRLPRSAHPQWRLEDIVGVNSWPDFTATDDLEILFVELVA